MKNCEHIWLRKWRMRASVSETLIDEMNETEVFKPVYLFNNITEALEKLSVENLML